jgi:hypothetical protein
VHDKDRRGQSHNVGDQTSGEVGSRKGSLILGQALIETQAQGDEDACQCQESDQMIAKVPVPGITISPRPSMVNCNFSANMSLGHKILMGASKFLAT